MISSDELVDMRLGDYDGSYLTMREMLQLMELLSRFRAGQDRLQALHGCDSVKEQPSRGIELVKR